MFFLFLHPFWIPQCPHSSLIFFVGFFLFFNNFYFCLQVHSSCTMSKLTLIASYIIFDPKKFNLSSNFLSIWVTIVIPVLEASSTNCYLHNFLAHVDYFLSPHYGSHFPASFLVYQTWLDSKRGEFYPVASGYLLIPINISSFLLGLN